MAKSAVKKVKTEEIVSTKKLTKVKKEKKKDKEVIKSKPVKEKIEKVLKNKKLKKEVDAVIASLDLPTVVEGKNDGELKISSKVLEKAVLALKAGIEKTTGSNAKENLFSDEVRYGMQVVFAKIPKIPAHNRKILLKNSLFGDESPDIMFIIRDKAKKEKTTAESVHEFEEFLKKNGVDNVKTVITLTQLKKDYGPHNMKLKLLHSYDIFLVEPEIAEHTYSFLGKHFIVKRKRPFQVHTKNIEKMKMAIHNATMKSSFKLGSSSNFSVIEIGTHKMENSAVVENVKSTLKQLKETWPGGYRNILRLYLKPMMPSKISIPIYYSKIDPNDVEIPVEKGPKQMRRDHIAKKLEKTTKKLRFDSKTKKVVKEKKISTAIINKKIKEKKPEGKVKTTANLAKMNTKKKDLKKNAN